MVLLMAHKPAYSTYTLVGINTAVYALMCGGIALPTALDSAQWPERWWTLLTYAFTHDATMHFAVNMFALLMIGRRLERHYRRLTVLAAYLAGAMAGGASFVLISALAGKAMTLAGASAAVLTLGAMALMRGERTRLALMKVKVSVRTLALAAVALIVLCIAFGPNPGGDVAHLSGIAVGVGIGWCTRRGCTVDALIAKVERSGYGSLTEAERKQLFSMSNQK